MEIQKQSKLFAFKLAEKQAETKPATQWKVREGVSVAGCCDPTGENDLRMDDPYWGRDQGFYC